MNADSFFFSLFCLCCRIRLFWFFITLICSLTYSLHSYVFVSVDYISFNLPFFTFELKMNKKATINKSKPQHIEIEEMIKRRNATKKLLLVFGLYSKNWMFDLLVSVLRSCSNIFNNYYIHMISKIYISLSTNITFIIIIIYNKIFLLNCTVFYKL